MNTHDIKRYAVSGDIAYPIHEDPEGEYVTYEDHVAAIEADRKHIVDLIARYQEKIRALEAENYALISESDNRQSREPYNHKRIAWEIERTAMGDGFYGNALRVAKDMPVITAEDRSVLDRYATGKAHDTDHAALQDIARKIYFTPEDNRQARSCECQRKTKAVIESEREL